MTKPERIQHLRKWIRRYMFITPFLIILPTLLVAVAVWGWIEIGPNITMCNFALAPLFIAIALGNLRLIKMYKDELSQLKAGQR